MTDSSSLSKSNLFRRSIALALWALIALAYLAFFVMESRLDFMQIQAPCQGTQCNWMALSTVEVETLESLGLSATAYAVYMLGSATISVAVYWVLAGLILWRYGATRIGLAVSLVLLVMPITAVSDANNLYAAYPELRVPSILLSTTGWIISMTFIYLFPNGRFYPRWAYIPLIVSIIFFVINSLREIQGAESLSTAQNPWFLGVLLTVFVGILFQILRYFRSSKPAERQQTKWTLFGLLILAVGFPIWGLIFGGGLEVPVGSSRLIAFTVGWLLVIITGIALPVTLVIAILRYRLWDIDILIRRTLVYGGLTVTLGLIYFASVLLLQNLLTAASGRLTEDGGPPSTVAIVLSTLAIAALFSPLRRRIQRGIDRRFYRRKYDAEKALAAFNQTVREEVDLEVLSQTLLAVVNDTMKPEYTSLWLLDSADDGPRSVDSRWQSAVHSPY